MKKMLIIFLFSIGSLFALETATADNFDQKISNQNVIVDFYATWWLTCEALGKSLTKFNASKSQDVKVIKIDVEKEPQLAQRYNVRAVPTIVYLKNGKVVGRDFGFKSPEDLQSDAKKYFK